MSDERIDRISENAAEKLKNSPQYQQLQNDLAQKKALAAEQEAPKKVKFDVEDKVSLFQWKKDESGGFSIRATERAKPADKKEREASAERVLRVLGYEINLSDRVDTLKDNFMRLYVESKSHNLLLSKFAQLKYGMTMQILALLGVSSEEIRKLQKQALEGAIDENEALFEQNEYNLAMLTLFGNKKKDRSKLKVFDETRRQLITQMNQYRSAGYYSKERILGIQKNQYEKIKTELTSEKNNLEYLMHYAPAA